MRFLRSPSLLSLATISLIAACDPGSGIPDDPTRSGKGGASYATTEINPLLSISRDPPGQVDMRPPLAGALDAFAQNRALGRSVNLGNGLDSPKNNNWGLRIEPYMFQVIKDAGFDSIRLPVKWSDYADKTAPYTIDASFFVTVDLWIAHALTRGLPVMLDVHHYGQDGGKEPSIYAQPEAEHARFLAIWEQIAQHYKDYPKELYFEILNEPRGALESFWNQYLGEAIAVIRQSNPGRTLVVGGNEYNKWYRLKDVVFPDGDQNIIATFHYYNPYCFTMQDRKQSWDKQSGCDPTNGATLTGKISWPVVYPEVDPDPPTTAKTQREKLAQDMADAAAWAKSANRPLHMGEFGVLKTVDDATRVDYISTLARAAEANGISWAYWELGAQYGIWDQNALAWNAKVLAALIPDQTDPTADPSPAATTSGGAAGVSSTPSTAGAGGIGEVGDDNASVFGAGGAGGAGGRTM